MALYYPPTGFHFKVEVLGFTQDSDTRFTEVSGLSVDLNGDEVPEGGENRFVQKFPSRPKYPDLVLKRGLLVNSDITNWIRDCLGRSPITPKNLDIKLLNEQHQPLMTWHVVNAYPTKWAVSDLNASNNAVTVETLQFYYQYFTVDQS